MEEKIIELLKTENRGFDITEIEDYLGIKDALGLAEVLKCLHSLEEAATVYQSKSKNICYLLIVILRREGLSGIEKDLVLL